MASLSTIPSARADEELLQAGFRFAFALTHHREEAEDLVQETWLKLSKRYGKVENSSLLFTAIRHLFIDQCRRKKLIYFESLDQPEVDKTEYKANDEPGIKGELAVLLAKLSPAERELIFLHYYQGHTAEEISQITAQPRGTILSSLHRSVSKLRKICAKQENQEFCSQVLPLLALLLSIFQSHRP